MAAKTREAREHYCPGPCLGIWLDLTALGAIGKNKLPSDYAMSFC
jgi:hypothetical protein